jgi:hypothetical protein
MFGFFTAVVMNIAVEQGVAYLLCGFGVSGKDFCDSGDYYYYYYYYYYWGSRSTSCRSADGKSPLHIVPDCYGQSRGVQTV